MTAKSCRGQLKALDAANKLLCQLFTIEKCWIPDSDGGLAGEPNLSCISPGTYQVDPYTRHNGDRVWILSNPELDVFQQQADIPHDRSGKGRFGILIHVANRASEVQGCIAPGRNWTTDDEEPIVTDSRAAMFDLHTVLDGESDIELEILVPAQKRKRKRKLPARKK